VDPSNIILPAINGTTTLLHSAIKFPSIHRIVITSSLVAILPGSTLVHGDAETIYTSSSRVLPLPTAPWNSAYAYPASKALALDATDRFLVEDKPHFTIVNLHPGFAVGENLLVDKAEDLEKGSNRIVLDPLLGKSYEKPNPAATVHIQDIARAHILSLNEDKVKGNKNFILGGGKMKFEDIFGIVKREFPEAVEEGILPLGGEAPSVFCNLEYKESGGFWGVQAV
jgi:nucleoside-diphosphate-sugar epimerase